MFRFTVWASVGDKVEDETDMTRDKGRIKRFIYEGDRRQLGLKLNHSWLSLFGLAAIE